MQTPPLGADSRIWALGLTFADHMQETGERSNAPLVFAKPCQPSLGGGVLHVPSQKALRQALDGLNPARQMRLSERVPDWPVLLDYEVELGLILLDDWHVGEVLPSLGYVLVNDVTARSIQIAGLGADDPLKYWSAAKGFDGFLPMSRQMGRLEGANAETWPDMVLSTQVNGELRQRAHLRLGAFCKPATSWRCQQMAWVH
jgi:2-keto-4-pentenoate hydratase/2-oxohepta-3-ene-1,7-dioic acid hydratase in catechol pathway